MALTQKQLKKRLKYSKKTGLFVRKRIDGSGNGKHIGEIAGSLSNYGYVKIMVMGKYYVAHHLAWLYMYGKLPTLQLDHKDRDRSNNRIKNLREVTNLQNSRNKGKPKNNTSGAVGVYPNKKGWFASIRIEGRGVYLGRFVEYHEAVNARKNAEVRYGFDKNHGGA